MRFRRRLLLVPLAWAACFSPSSGGSTPSPDFDSGLTEFDGTTEDAAEDVAPAEAAADVQAEAAPTPIKVVVVGASGYEKPGGMWSTATTEQIIGVTNVPDGGTEQVTYSEVNGGILAPLQQRSPPADAGAAALAAVQTHMGFPEWVQVEAPEQSNYDGTEQDIAVVLTTATPTTSGTITVDATSMATAPSFQNLSTGGTTQPSITWTLASGDLHQATGVVTVLSYFGSTVDGGLQNGTWTIVSPGTSATSLTAPQLPPGAPSAYAPGAGSNLTPVQIFAVYGQTSMPTYGSMLPIASTFVVQPCGSSKPVVPPLPALGSALIVSYAPEDEC